MFGIDNLTKRWVAIIPWKARQVECKRLQNLIAPGLCELGRHPSPLVMALEMEKRKRMLEFRKTPQNQFVVVSLEGNLNSSTSRTLQQEFAVLTEDSHPTIVLDVTSLLQIDSAGVGVLVSLYKQLQQQEKALKVAGLTGQPQEVFKLLNLHKVLELFPTVNDAITPVD